ncbi:DUF6778 family protein [Aliiroseovarius crassostreae]|uniref:DUF6778 family protein n=1 Tax=Aliiroseovarius crassostreae TaxID=154981 RepID=UPI00220CDEB8|nr:DUF6778 family protein [Aliiroseovarius crassostreae]UWQ09359.1 hypothetical protein K3X25_07365 [Aliiroseovarius crassostreae]
MKLGKLFLGMVAIAALSACMKPGEVTRAQPSNLELGAASDAQQPKSVEYNVTDVRVTVPRSLTVSEANSLKPKADIVWREDPLGDRYKQVQVILDDAFDRGVSTLNKGRPVVLEITLQEFHALTQRTRYTYGGTHALRFDLTVLDAKTGMILEPKRTIQNDLRAFGGEEALAAEARGETQKVRITAHLAAVIYQEMTRPRDFLPADFVPHMPQTTVAAVAPEAAQ